MIAVFALVSVLAATSAGRPPSPEEQRLFDEGMRAFQAGDARGAEKAWKAGYQVGKDAAFLVRVGEAEEKAGDAPAAADSYRRYLREVPDASDRAEIEQRLARLGVAAAPPPAVAATDEREVPGAFGDGASATRAPAPAAATPAPAHAPPARDDELGRGPARGAEEPPPSGWNAYNISAWISVAATVTLLGAAGYLAASAGSHRDDVNQLQRYRDQTSGAPLEYQAIAQQYEDGIKSGQRDARWARWALWGAAATAGVAAIFFVIDETRPSEPAARDRRAAASRPRRTGIGFAVVPDGRGAAALTSLGWTF